MTVKPLSYWRVRPAPSWPTTVGQGEMPSGPPVEMSGADGDRHSLPLAWGQLVRASATCDPDRGLANLDAQPVPLLRIDVVRQLAQAGLLMPVGQDADGDPSTADPA